jgi:hypothetical protein
MDEMMSEVFEVLLKAGATEAKAKQGSGGLRSGIPRFKLEAA